MCPSQNSPKQMGSKGGARKFPFLECYDIATLVSVVQTEFRILHSNLILSSDRDLRFVWWPQDVCPEATLNAVVPKEAKEDMNVSMEVLPALLVNKLTTDLLL